MHATVRKYYTFEHFVNIKELLEPTCIYANMGLCEQHWRFKMLCFERLR
jgi:hypothetical protein